MIKDLENVLLQVIDILYAFCYEFRIMDSELNSESVITIQRTSSVLHCFCCENNVKEILKLSFLKCLTYSFIRNFEVCCKVSSLQLFLRLIKRFSGFRGFKTCFISWENHDFKNILIVKIKIRKK